MDLLASMYGEDDLPETVTATLPSESTRITVNPTPQVKELQLIKKDYQSIKAKNIDYNLDYETLYAPVNGPHIARHRDDLLAMEKNVPTGYVAATQVNGEVFDQQFHAFNGRGVAIDPSGDGSTTVGQERERDMERKNPRKRKASGSAADVSGYLGPWAPYEDMMDSREEPIKMTAAHLALLEGRKREPNPQVEEDIPNESSVLHGAEFDYQGRSWIEPPSGFKPADHQCYIPKQCVHTWNGHTKGVNAIRFFPNTAHLLLSCAMDNKVKIWDVYGKREVKRTYLGHELGVKDVAFNYDGTKFLSAGYDKKIRLWDTETGECIRRFTNGRFPHVVKFHPSADKGTEFLSGMSDSKIVQWDSRQPELSLEYNEHLGPVNSICFIDENRRFVSTSDDKSIRVWDYGIPVSVKYICEPHMYSMPQTCLTPDAEWVAAQSLDNQIVIYSTQDRFRLHKRKRFAGHINAGYAIQIGFSPDGRYLITGDTGGQLWFYDFKTSKILTTLKCHKKVTIGCLWHPLEPSQVATCSWDGSIKLWD